MMTDADRVNLERFMEALGKGVSGPGTIYLTGWGCSLAFRMAGKNDRSRFESRSRTAWFFKAIADLEESRDNNVEFAIALL